MEYEWTGVVSVWEGRAHQRGEVQLLTAEEAAPLLAAGAVVLRTKAEAERKASAKAEAKPPEVKPNA
jgi:hypothetical protein